MKKNYLNLGCGDKYHKDWINIDLIPQSPEVIKHDLSTGIPFPDNQFEVVYLSQVLEHLERGKAPNFIQECYRVLQPKGIIRIVVPDLENIVREYLKYLELNLTQPNALYKANYDWLMLEIYDQTIRNQPGGQMAAYLQQTELINEAYIIDRIGFVGQSIRKSFLEDMNKQKNPHITRQLNPIPRWLKKIRSGLNPQSYKRLLLRWLLNKTEKKALEIGKFRLAGEIHYWMYDRYSLENLLKHCGFENVKQMNPYQSDIPNWHIYELDARQEFALDPTSLFMEASKP